MKLFSAALVSALFAASASVALADTITLASYGTTNTAPAGVGNSATKFNGAIESAFPYIMGPGPTYNLGTGGVWANPTGSSSWVGINTGDSPSGSHVEPLGIYEYTSTFYISGNASNASGTITVMADDTTDVYLNGTEIVAAANFFDPASHCTAGTPNCETPVTFTLTGFTTGLNTLKFDVDQDYGSATGIDFSGTVNVTPEPDSLLLLGTGLAMFAGLAYSRRVHA